MINKSIVKAMPLLYLIDNQYFVIIHSTNIADNSLMFAKEAKYRNPQRSTGISHYLG